MPILLVRRCVTGERKVTVRAVDDDRALIAAIAEGDQAAFQELYAAYYKRLWRYVWYQLGGNVSRTEEVLQDIFFAIWRSAGRFRGDAKVATWIFQIAHNKLSTTRHALGRSLDEKAAWLTEGMDDDMDENEMREASFEDASVNRLALVDAIERLSAKHQAVIYLVFVQGFALDEVASILGVPPNTVKSRIISARRALLKQLGTQWIAEGGRHDAR